MFADTCPPAPDPESVTVSVAVELYPVPPLFTVTAVIAPAETVGVATA